MEIITKEDTISVIQKEIVSSLKEWGWEIVHYQENSSEVFIKAEKRNYMLTVYPKKVIIRVYNNKGKRYPTIDRVCVDYWESVGDIRRIQDVINTYTPQKARKDDERAWNTSQPICI